ncbi:MAG: hypothetical protein KKH94_08325 [Candidatus Omnitrophica bacterium]|nr:hypothetical protein [Candidatus Omnitrophota bacterium]
MEENSYYVRLVKAISPICATDVCTTISRVCRRNKIHVENISQENLSVIKQGLLVHYKIFVADKVDAIKETLDMIE